MDFWGVNNGHFSYSVKEVHCSLYYNKVKCGIVRLSMSHSYKIYFGIHEKTVILQPKRNN